MTFVACIWCFWCTIFIWPCDLDLWPFDLGGVQLIRLHTSNAHTSFEHPTIIHCRVMGDAVWSHTII